MQFILEVFDSSITCGSLVLVAHKNKQKERRFMLIDEMSTKREWDLPPKVQVHPDVMIASRIAMGLIDSRQALVNQRVLEDNRRRFEDKNLEILGRIFQSLLLEFQKEVGLNLPD